MSATSSVSSSTLLPPSLNIGDFLIGRALGEGAFARVFHAKKKESNTNATNREYAVKVMEKRFIIKENKMSQVHMERKALSECNHPFIVHLFFSFHDKDRLYLVLDFCSLGELAKMIKHSTNQSRALSESVCRPIFAEVVLAVHYLHAKQFLHRDLKPENILINALGHVKLTDFGTAKLLVDNKSQGQPQQQQQQRKDTFCGTAEYVSPETLLDQEAGVGADYWALGITLFSMLVGHTPFWFESEFLTFQCILQYAGVKSEMDVPMVSFDSFPPGKTVLSAPALLLIQELLAPQPENRVGVSNPRHVLEHSFFQEVDFVALEKGYKLPSPNLVTLESLAGNTTTTMSTEQFRDGAKPELWLMADEDVDDDTEILLMMKPPSKEIPQQQQRKDSAQEETGDSVFQRFLDKDEKLISQHGVLQQSFGGFISSKRQLCCTNRQRVLLVDETSKKEEWVWDSTLQVKVLSNKREFELIQPNKKTYRLRGSDAQHGGEYWKKILQI